MVRLYACVSRILRWARSRHASLERPGRKLRVCSFEERVVPAAILVTTTADNGNNAAPTPGSLRAAILTADGGNIGVSIDFSQLGGAGPYVFSQPAGA